MNLEVNSKDEVMHT